MKRHNLAMEQLSKAREEYSEERQQRLDYVKKTIRGQKHAEQTFSDLGVAMQQFYKVTGHQLAPLRDPPKLSDSDTEKTWKLCSLSVEWLPS